MKPRPGKGGGLSLCMIVRNEAPMLPAFLDSVKGLWDELCVVDTGSNDGTIALLHAAGARVFHHPWRDDFAAARNESLAQAQGEWILILDADERPSPSLKAEIRSLLARADVGAATLQMCNAQLSGNRRQSTLLRLFRQHPSLRFQHRIHEEVSSTVTAYLQVTGLSLVHLKGAVEHLGYARSHAAQRNKRERDSRLLEAALTEAPSDLYSHLKLLELHRFWNDRPAWRQAAQRATEVVQALPRAQVQQTPFAGELVALAAQALYGDRPEQGLSFLEQQGKDLMPVAPYLFLRGQWLECTGAFAQARADFEACLAPKLSATDLQLTSVRPRMGLARLALAAQNWKQARHHMELALQANPRDPEALLACLSLTRMEKGPGALEAFVTHHVREHGASDELADAVGEEALRAGDLRQARTALTRAGGETGNPAASLWLARASLAEGSLTSCRSLAQQIKFQNPEAVLGLLVCDMLEGQDSDLELELGLEEASLSLHRWLEALKLAEDPSLLATMKARSAALTPYFPWLAPYLRSTEQPLPRSCPTSPPNL